MSEKIKKFLQTLPEEKRRQFEKSWKGVIDNEEIQPKPALEQWGDPIPFETEAVPAFPIDALPEPFGEFAKALAKSTQTPVDLAGNIVLSVVSVAVARKAEVQVHDVWREPINIWTATLLEPSNLKSPVVQACSRPVEEYEKQLIDKGRGDVEEARRLYTLKEKQIEQLTATAAKVNISLDEQKKQNQDNKDSEKLVKQIQKLSRELAEMAVPAPPKLLTADCTPERLASILAEQKERVGILSGEGGLVFSIMSGRYSQAPNLDVYLSAYSGERYLVDRRGRTEILKRPALSMGLACQPTVIESLGASRDYILFRERGLLARFMFSIPRSLVGKRDVGAFFPVPAHAQAAYSKKILALLEMPVNDNVPLIQLTCKALDLFVAFRLELEPKLSSNGELGNLQDWAGKLHGQVVRLAGLLHLAKLAGENQPWERRIEPETMAAAIKLGRYYLGHAVAAFGRMESAGSQGKYPQRILEYMQRKDGNRVSRGQLYQQFKRSYPKIEQLDAALKMLLNRDLVRVAKPKITKKGGRPPKEYVLNAATDYPHNPQNTEGGNNGNGSRD